MDQLRADALVNGVLNGIAGELPTEQGRQPGINVTISLDTLVGATEQPGWLDGYGPISAGYARQLGHDPTGTWRRLVTDPLTGQLLDYGTTRYRPPRQLADHVIERDGECAFPFCNHSARRADSGPHHPVSARANHGEQPATLASQASQREDRGRLAGGTRSRNRRHPVDQPARPLLSGQATATLDPTRRRPTVLRTAALTAARSDAWTYSAALSEPMAASGALTEPGLPRSAAVRLSFRYVRWVLNRDPSPWSCL